eukprot:105093_1
MSLEAIAKTDDVVELATELINVKSITNHEYPMALALRAWLEPRGWTCQLQMVQPNRFNVLAYPKDTDPTTARVLFNTHIDTVPPYFGPAYIKNNKLFGRGACDTKSIIASQLIAANTLYTTHGIRRIALLYTVGEEVDSIGMIHANKLNLNPSYLITGEPTESRTCIGQKGYYGCILKSSGKAAHSAYPECGQCALTPLLNILHAIQNETWPKHKLFGETTTNICITKGGIAANIIPHECEAEVSIRTSVNIKMISRKIKTFVETYDRDHQIQLVEFPGCSPIKYETVDDSKYNPMVVAFATDIPSFENVANGTCKAILFGPGSITVAHSDHEHIDIDELKQSVQKYQDIALYCLAKVDRKSKL